ncbi:MAG: hypothetical protein OEY16_05445, partial [Alphaproteobacteria bacterium]|nr:hypothetical protein [Alphaproteobacteria bacterium]
GAIGGGMKLQQQYRMNSGVACSAPRDVKNSYRTLALFVVIGSFVLSSAFFIMVLSDGNSSFFMDNFCDVRWVETEQVKGSGDWYCSYSYGNVFLYVVLYSAIFAFPILVIMYALTLVTRLVRLCWSSFIGRSSRQTPE